MEEARAVAEALRLLEIDQLVLSLQDVSFPAGEGDLGRGSPYSPGARRFLAFVRSLGFTGIQFGPQGLQDQGSASPYEAAIFSRNPLNLDPTALVAQELLAPSEVDDLLERRPPGSAVYAEHTFVFTGSRELLQCAAARAQQRPEVLEEVERFGAEQAAWLVRDGLYEALCELYQDGWWRTWSGAHAQLDRQLFAPPEAQAAEAVARCAELQEWFAQPLRRYAFAQWVLWRQHRQLRETLRSEGLRGYGDLQVGLSARDEWAQQAALLKGYRLGAPPSRTNPLGQPWNYPVLDPALYQGRALGYFRARVQRLLQDHEGLRIDHPHGLVCPWVYRDDTSDPLRAVQQGARLFSSPALPDHPGLARYAIARPDQLALEEPRFSDSRVQALTEEQIARYALLFDAVMAQAKESGARDPVLGEVLSTMPFPLRQVFERHGLGRFRVTQKANLRDARDVYRAENAAPADWVMLGNHDTPPIWRVLSRWRAQGQLEERAAYLAWRLEPTAGRREAFAAGLRARDGAMAEAMLADALSCPARNVQLFFADLFGLDEVFNTPGTVGPENWRLRVPSDYALIYPLDRKARRALNLPGALALALRAKGEAMVSAQASLIARLETLANQAS